MNPLTEIVREYEKAYRDLVTFRNLGTNQNGKDVLRLNKEQDWSFICTALDVIGDTTLAIKNFLEFGLEGATGGSNDGEKYLRLYGVLNSTYLQQEAIQTLCKKTNLHKSNSLKQEVDKLRIREIRHKIGAHSSDYGGSKEKESYALIRNTLSGYNFEYLNNETLVCESVDLKECLEQHLSLIISLLDKIYETSIKTIYQDEHIKQKKELKKLTELHKLKSNNPNNI